MKAATKQTQITTHTTPTPHNPITDLTWFALVAATVKLLLIPAYHSTDFEVHRHWLALTHTLPFSQWYSNETSPWTLDYPPFFGYFERFLSLFAHLIDPIIVDLHKGLNYSSPSVIIFQRVSVIVSDTVMIYGVYRLTQNLESRKRILIWVLIVWSPGLLIVDHLHFQYNGFLLGILLLSLSWLEEGKDLMGGFVFAVLLCFKHLFAVAAPVYFVYLLRHYCSGGVVRGFGRLVMMGAAVVAVFMAAYGPFVYYGEIQQVFQRMFPFGRGLCHAYWAPNFWVFYIIFDKGLAFLLAKLGFSIQAPTASFTGGLVGDSSPLAVLPQITPLITFMMVLVALSPCLIKAWKDPQPRMITRWVSYAYMCGFLFGWHVHEKASLHFVIPLAIVAAQSVEDARHYLLLSIVSCYSLFPLLFEAQEYPIKVLLLLLHFIVMWFGFLWHFSKTIVVEETVPGWKRGDKSRLKGSSGTAKKQGFYIGWTRKCYLLGLLAVETWGQFLHPIVFGTRLPFLPLMMISIYCSLGMMYSWIWQLRWILRSH
ncbi:probable dolichyl pyrophosphate Glc1Man9GlcNAc2 alpha-1,3-glucosyltransferase [Cornus florida]|uniref:probable dolichyl pyrophosphate Glc1Man9GlcNAc2 alpha-1,3-glucosyltransferase n=1 Tax=Cornus florida TaxID=4283 RepID=UPI002897E15D|nr:probable dolichyl pyrophosphate Glc1Man9GlcNAc2 alpha-1,3-glucosyltransferase [Cornus florida]XP_059636797.1 probable dolichyl pyrophosphate Glc1Man9GlcNAc2 alpha-1,3-glucosyltransferase [Cornus florida]XP_059636798.1 probable dolichyl pyrophosphate Glc1Man9GlcNAc2 alpha-1,3-glucosyltransferase [Cornus florida]